MKKTFLAIMFLLIVFFMNSCSSRSQSNISKTNIKESLYEAINDKDFNQIVNDVISLEIYNIKQPQKKTYNTSLSQYGDLRTQSPTINGNFRLKL